MATKKSNRAARAVIETLEDRQLMSVLIVSNSGSDNGAGTSASPLATIQAALNRAQSGDAIWLESGTYQGGFTISTPNITLRSAPGQSASITTSSADVTVRIGEDANNTRLINLDISGGNVYAVKTESTWDTGASNPHGPSGLLIRNSKIHDSGADVVKLTPDTSNVRILNNEIYNSGRISPGNAEGIDAVQANNAIVRGNYIHDITTNGVYFKGGSQNTLIESNRVENCGYSGILLGQSSDENWFDTNADPNYYENIDGIVRYNTVSNVQGAGVGAWAALRPQIYGNTLTNVAQSMFAGLLVQGQEHWPSVGPQAGQDVIIPSTDVQMYGNRVSVFSDRPCVQVRDQGLTGSLTMYNNKYNQNGNQVQIDDQVIGFTGTLGQWKAMGYDQGSRNTAIVA